MYFNYIGYTVKFPKWDTFFRCQEQRKLVAQIKFVEEDGRGTSQNNPVLAYFT